MEFSSDDFMVHRFRKAVAEADDATPPSETTAPNPTGRAASGPTVTQIQPKRNPEQPFSVWREQRIAELRLGLVPRPLISAPPTRLVKKRKRELKGWAPPLVVSATGSPREQALHHAAPLFDVKWDLVASGCWLWSGATSGKSGSKRRGDFRVGGSRGRVERAHRVSYELRVGPIPQGLTIDHLCFETRCVNPAHLEPVPMSENTRRYVVKMQGEKTTCKKGHPLDGLNKAGSRFCRECSRIITKDYGRRNPEKVRDGQRRYVKNQKARAAVDPVFAEKLRQRKRAAARKTYLAKRADPARWTEHNEKRRIYDARVRAAARLPSHPTEAP